MNSVNLVGRLGDDPEIRYTQDGTAIATFSLAVSRGRDETDWVDVTCWEQQAETVSQYVRKGHLVAVSGRLRQEKWETDAGEKRSKLGVVAQRVDFLTPKDAAA